MTRLFSIIHYAVPMFAGVVAVLLLACTPHAGGEKAHDIGIHPANDSIRYLGRVRHDGDSVAMYWSGSGIRVKFRGRSLKALLRDEFGKNYFNIVLDGDSLRYRRLDATKKFYDLASDLPDGEHTVELLKRNEWDTGETWLYGFETEGKLEPLPRPARAIEFFGNSITAGYAIENYTGGDSPDSIYTNNYNTYAAITARHFGADYYCTVRSGIGVMISWFPLTMPEMYNRLDPRDATSRWDFTQVQPQVVVINLFQNDRSLMNYPNHPLFKARFGTKPPESLEIVKAYENFIRSIRTAYPNAHIICALGCMDAAREDLPWAGYIRDAVVRMNDVRTHVLIFPYIKSAGHPRREENKVMADTLIGFIEKHVSW